MTIATITYAVGADIAGLETSIAAGILAGKKPSLNPPAFIDGLWILPMYTGSDPNSIADIQDDVATNGTNITTNTSGIAALVAINTPVLITGDGAIPTTLSSQSIITDASAAALTLAATATNGIRKKIASGTSAAHVITATGLLQDGSNEAGNTITFANKKGAAVELLSYNSKWLVIGGNHYTVA